MNPAAAFAFILLALANPSVASERGAALRRKGRDKAHDNPKTLDLTGNQNQQSPSPLDQALDGATGSSTASKTKAAADQGVDRTKDAAENSRVAKKMDDLKSVYDKPPDSVKGGVEAAAKIMDVPTQPPYESPAEIPGHVVTMYTQALSMNILGVLSTLFFTLLIICALAFLYSRFKETASSAAGQLEQGVHSGISHMPGAQQFEHGLQRAEHGLQSGLSQVPGMGQFTQGPGANVHSANLLDQGNFRYGLFDCFSADRIVCCTALCCPSIRWADTMRMAGIFSFWTGVLLFAALLNLATATAGLSSLILLCITTWKRHVIRQLFDMPTGFGSCALDCMTYFCCACCAIIQEARQMEEAHAVKHKVLKRIKVTPLRNVPIVDNPVDVQRMAAQAAAPFNAPRGR